MDKRVILFNGPPGSGKDTAVNHVVRYLKGRDISFVKHEKMAQPLKAAVHALFGMVKSPEYYDEVRSEKEKPHPLLFDMSPRQAYIGLSEQAIKPWLGNDVFGRIMANKMHNDNRCYLHVFSDGGFVDEWRPIVDYLGASSVRVVELHSTSCSWSGDSRGYIGDELKALYPNITVTRLNNTISKDPMGKQLFLLCVQGIVDQVLGL